ncbi:MAG: SpoIIE family protein phosphatase [Acidimicrobiia bacterium]
MTDDRLDDAARLRLLEAALEQTRAAACITTAELDAPGPTIVYVNPAYCAMTGRRREDVIGLTPRVMQGPLTDRAELDRLRTDLEAGRTFEGETVNYRADGTPFIISWRIDPVTDDAGVTTHYVATQADVTDERRNSRLLAAMRLVDQAHTAAVNDPAPADDDIERVAEAVAQALRTVAPWGTAIAGARVRLPGGTVEVGGPPPSPRGLVLDDARVGFVAGGADETVWAVIGPLTIDERRFVHEPSLRSLADRAGLVIGAVAEFERRRTEAIVLQSRLLPPTELEVPGFEVASRFRPGEVGSAVGGDWFEVHQLGGRRTAVVIGDIAGDGVQAAAEMGRVRLVLERALAETGRPGPALETTGDWCAAEGVFATACVVVVGPGGRAMVASAGHPLPLLADRRGRVASLDVAVGPPLGVGDVDVPGGRFSIAPGERLVLVTDGVVERRDEALDEGLARLARLVAPLDGVVATADAAVAAAPGSDDAAVVVLARR